MNASTEQWTPKQLKEAIIRNLSATRARSDAYSFRFVQAQLRAAGMPTAQGWEPLLEKYRELSLKNVSLPQYEGVTGTIFWNSLFCGSRAVFVLEATASQLELFKARSSQLMDSTSSFAAAFPYPITEAALRKASYSGKFVSTVSAESGDMWLFSCAKRSYKTREPIVIDELSSDAQHALGAFDEVIGVKNGLVQAYDAVVVRPKKGRVEIHIDICCPFSQFDINQAYNYYVGKLNNIIISDDDEHFDLTGLHNFFPDIQRLYNTKDGKVASLGHATGTKSIKQERMRGRHLDLREELFHKEGMREIGETDAFSIRKGWPSSNGVVPTATIPGHASLVEMPGAIIPYAIIENCQVATDFDKVMNHLVIS